MTSSFWKSSILKMFSVHIKTQNRRFQFLGFEECFRLKSARFRGKSLWTEDLTIEIFKIQDSRFFILHYFKFLLRSVGEVSV